MRKPAYKHVLTLRPGDVIHIGGIPYEYLGGGRFGSNTNPATARALSPSPATEDRHE